jgi:hypothetical protein
MRYTFSDLGTDRTFALPDALARLPEQLQPGHIGHILAVTTDHEPLPAVAIDYQVDPDGTVSLEYAFSEALPAAERHAWEAAIAPYQTR